MGALPANLFGVVFAVRTGYQLLGLGDTATDATPLWRGPSRSLSRSRAEGTRGQAFGIRDQSGLRARIGITLVDANDLEPHEDLVEVLGPVLALLLQHLQDQL